MVREGWQFANLIFQISRLAVCFAKAQMLVHLQVHVDKEMAIELMSSKVVNGQSASLRGRANRIEHVLASLRAWLHMHHDVGGNDLADAPLDRVADGMHPFQAQPPRKPHR